MTHLISIFIYKLLLFILDVLINFVIKTSVYIFLSMYRKLLFICIYSNGKKDIYKLFTKARTFTIFILYNNSITIKIHSHYFILTECFVELP